VPWHEIRREPTSTVFFGGGYDMLWAVGPESRGLARASNPVPTYTRWTWVGDWQGQFVANDLRVFFLPSNRESVRQFTGRWAEPWVPIGGAARTIFAAGRYVYAIAPNYDLYRCVGFDQPWEPVGGPGAAFAPARSGEPLWALSPNRDSVQEFRNGAWSPIGGAGYTALIAGPNELYAQSETGIFRYEGRPMAWTQLGDAGAAFAATHRGLYGLSPARDSVWEYESPGRWREIGGPARDLFGGGGFLCATSPEDGSLWAYEPERPAGGGTAVAVGGAERVNPEMRPPPTLTLYRDPNSGRYATTTSAHAPRGYTAVRREAELHPHSGGAFTAALDLLLHAASGQYVTTARAEFAAELTRRGYVRLTTMGWVSPRPWAPFRSWTRALKLYRSPSGEDHQTVLSVESERAALESGWQFVAIEGWVHVPNLDGVPTIDGAEPLEWHEFAFDHVLSAGDFIAVTEEAGTAGEVEFALEAGRRVTWQKELAIVDADGSTVARATTVNEARTAEPLRLPLGELAGRALVLRKARFGGAVHSVYALDDLTSRAGKRITFHWASDGTFPRLPRLGWGSFENLLPDGDIITVSDQPGEAGVVEIWLAAGPRVGWWKSLRISDHRLDFTQSFATDGDDRGPVGPIRLRADELARKRLLFSKAKTFGSRPFVYELTDLAGKLGRRVELRWMRDDLTHPRGGPRGNAFYSICGVSRGTADTEYNVLADGDIVTLQIEDLPGGGRGAEFVLRADPAVTWWKGLAFVNASDEQLAEISIEGEVGEAGPMVVGAEDLFGGALVFSKAKAFGEHRPIYEWSVYGREIVAWRGKRLTFSWINDNSTPFPGGTAGIC
jgi:hypothetical protein